MKKSMHKLVIGSALMLAGLPGSAHADFIDTTWHVIGFSGEAWYVNTQSIIGRSQKFYKGEAEGVFYRCAFKGQSSTYTTYQVDEFLRNPEFKLFQAVADDLGRSGPTIFVHRITCEGDGDPADRRVLYPFVTTEKRKSAFYLFEGGVFSLYAPE